MAEVLNKVIVSINGESAIVPLSTEEIAQHKLDVAASLEAEAARKAEADALEAAKVVAREKMVAGEPLTEDEAKLLIP